MTHQHYRLIYDGHCLICAFLGANNLTLHRNDKLPLAAD